MDFYEFLGNFTVSLGLPTSELRNKEHLEGLAP